MKASRMSARRHWINVGKNARSLGYPLRNVLTLNTRVNEWIREGYGPEGAEA